MSALPPWSFGRNAPRLARAEFEPIPITTCDQQWSTAPDRPPQPVTDPGKQPAMYGWQKGCDVADWPRYAENGVGILTRNTPSIDVDTTDQAIGDALQELIDKHLGEAPVRYGQAPKRLMPFRLKGAPFAKIKIVWKPIAGTGDEGREKPPGLECLAAGQQAVALGVHPVTGKPYVWHRDPDLSIPHALLPPLDQGTARRFMAVAARFIADIGGELKVGAAMLEKPRLRVVPTRRPQTATAERERIADALARIDGADDYDTWIRIGLALKAALGEGGFDLWCWWSVRSSKFDSRVTARKWATFKPDRIGAGSLFHFAEKGL